MPTSPSLPYKAIKFSVIKFHFLPYLFQRFNILIKKFHRTAMKKEKRKTFHQAQILKYFSTLSEYFKKINIQIYLLNIQIMLKFNSVEYSF